MTWQQWLFAGWALANSLLLITKIGHTRRYTPGYAACAVFETVLLVALVWSI